ncbi:MAG TPA: response regulator, partial [Bacillota bacterium]|nr:response regulator [Bacillota bacterium]
MTNWEHGDSPRLLIIDDNPSIHRDFDLVFVDELQNADLEADEQRIYGQQPRLGINKPTYRLDHALSGLEGIEKVRQALVTGQPYHLAFVDIRMPGIDGVETIERVWQLDPRLQVVICTAYADYSWGDLERRLGPTDKLLVLKKPFDNIEVTQLASTLTAKWLLAQQAALKLEQMELLVAQRTQKLLELQRGERREGGEPLRPHTEAALPAAAEAHSTAKEPPLILVVADTPETGRAISQGLGPD